MSPALAVAIIEGIAVVILLCAVVGLDRRDQRRQERLVELLTEWAAASTEMARVLNEYERRERGG